MVQVLLAGGDGAAYYCLVNGIGEVKHDVFMIAHRISTIKDCEIIIVLEEGKISSIGSYESLIKESENFKNLAAETKKLTT